MNVNIPIELCDKEAILPTYAHETDGAMDIYSCGHYIIPPGETTIVKTGLKTAIPDGYAILIQPRSGLSYKTELRIPNSPGLIDAGYRDEIGVIIQNTSSTVTQEINLGDRVAQMRLVEIPKVVWNTVDDINYFNGNRGGGFGSTGR